MKDKAFKFVAGWTLPPRPRLIALINSGLEAYARMEGLSIERSRRLQVAVEGVFAYCARALRAHDSAGKICVELYRSRDLLRVCILHCGPGGEFDTMLAHGKIEEIRRTSFEALGLVLAGDMADSLTFESRFDLTLGETLRSFRVEVVA